MYKFALAGLSVLATLTIISSSTKANALENTPINDIKIAAATPLVIASFDNPEKEEVLPAEPVITKHVVAEHESLSIIAKKYNTTWKRIYDKNTTVQNPDIITVGTELIVPNEDEVLTERTLPETQQIVEPAVQKTAQKPAPKPAVKTASVTTRGSSSGNLYVPGYCTWYVKNLRPDLPNNLGNADTWVSRAAAQGLATGSTPRAGAVGQRGMHVVYVLSVNSDGTVNITEMNHKGLYVVTTRTLPGDYFKYIY
jgi:surface antigen